MTEGALERAKALLDDSKDDFVTMNLNPGEGVVIVKEDDLRALVRVAEAAKNAWSDTPTVEDEVAIQEAVAALEDDDPPRP